MVTNCQSGYISLVPLDIHATMVEGKTKSKTEASIGTIHLVELHLSGKHDQCRHSDTGGCFPEGGAGKEDEGGAGLTETQRTSITEAGHKPDDYSLNRDGEFTPTPGTDSWRDTHGISKEVYEARPMVRYTSAKDPAFDEHFEGFPPGTKRFGQVTIASKEGGKEGLIMVRKPVPGAEEAGFGKIPPQIRPDEAIVLDHRQVTKRTRDVANAQARLERVKTFTPEDIIAEREAKVRAAKKEVALTKFGEPADIRRPAVEAQEKAQKKLDAATKEGDPDKIIAAKKEFNKADAKAKEAKKTANLVQTDRRLALEKAKQDQTQAEEALIRAKADPQKALQNAEQYAKNQVVRKQEQLEGVPVKYLFPKGAAAARIEANSDPQNIKNLTTGKGRVYFVMEGNIKADAALTAVKKEDPKAAVISVPSVTAWSQDETDFVAQKYLKGRDIILIPDADGISNDNVARQAVKLAGKLRSNGAGSVTVAAPPTVPGKRGKDAIETLYLPTGMKDGRKGLDDHLGLGKGTLGDLTYSDHKPPSYDLSPLTSKDTPGDQRFRPDSVKNANKSLNAISDMAGERGAGRISYDSIGAYTGMAPSSVGGSTQLLEKKGIIKIHHIFDPKKLGQGRRVPVMEYDEIKRVTKKAGVRPPDLELKYVDENDRKHEVAAIIEILDDRYVTKSGPSKTLASKFKSSLRTSSSAPKPALRVVPSSSGDRVVRTPEGAARYGVPIGSPIPEGVENSIPEVITATGSITLTEEGGGK